ncbi:hypothetical protein ACFE04_027905 [Oxalis oulophora]
MGSLGGETTTTSNSIIMEKKKAMWLYPKVLGFNPSERWGHSACYSNGSIYVFGGCCGGLHYSDVLVLNLDTMVWSTLITTGQSPGPRDSHSAVLVGSKIIVFGGTNGSKKVNDLHMLDFLTGEWTRPESKGIPPTPRESHTATLVGDRKMVIFGGSGEGESNYLNDLHMLDLTTMTWSSPIVKGDIPVPRDSHSSVSISNKLFVYGGDCGDRYHGDIEMLDMDSLTWTKLTIPGPSPGVRAGHAAVNIGTKVYVIGGVGDKRYYNDVWILNISTCSWTQIEIRGQQPHGRFSHTAVVTDSDIAIYGGCGEDERPLNELLVLQLGTEHPNGRYNISMCKIFGKHCNQDERKFPRERENTSKAMLFGNHIVRKVNDKMDIESPPPVRINSDTSHPKRKRTTSSRVWELSQSPQNSQPNDIGSSQKEARIIVQRNIHDPRYVRESQNNPKQSHYLHAVNAARQGIHCVQVEQKHAEAGSPQTLVGADVRGKVDGAFDSGLLMTATVNGRLFRGVLFAPGPGGIIPQVPRPAQNPSPPCYFPSAQPFSSSNHQEYRKPCQKPASFSRPDSYNGVGQAQMTRPNLGTRNSPFLIKEAKVKSDLQGVVLTLGPGSARSGL